MVHHVPRYPQMCADLCSCQLPCAQSSPALVLLVSNWLGQRPTSAPHAWHTRDSQHCSIAQISNATWHHRCAHFWCAHRVLWILAQHCTDKFKYLKVPVEREAHSSQHWIERICTPMVVGKVQHEQQQMNPMVFTSSAQYLLIEYMSHYKETLLLAFTETTTA